VVLADGTELSAYTVVITTGMSARTLDAPGMDALQGVGVYYGAAMTEAARYRDKDVCVVGGANSAGQGALFFSRTARSVTMIVRAPDLLPMMSAYLVDRIRATKNITVLTGAEVHHVTGTTALESVAVKSVETGAVTELPMSAMFVFIGVRPHTDCFTGTLALDGQGFICTGADLPREHGKPRGWPLEREPYAFETSIPGVFAAGDVRSTANRRVAAAVGEGSAAVYSVHRYLRTV
jgi:thioredoxin reductase (NADPH)